MSFKIENKTSNFNILNVKKLNTSSEKSTTNLNLNSDMIVPNTLNITDETVINGGISFSNRNTGAGLSYNGPTFINPILHTSHNSIFVSFQFSTGSVPVSYTVEGTVVNVLLNDFNTDELESLSGDNSIVVNVSVVNTDGTLHNVLLNSFGVITIVNNIVDIKFTLLSPAGSIMLTDQKIVIQCLLVDLH